MGLPCMNCKQPVEQEEANFFAGVFLCSTCYTYAERTYARGQRSVKHLLTMMKESIRVALIEGKLSPVETPEDLSKTDLLREVIRLEEGREQCRDSTSNTPSSVSPVVQNVLSKKPSRAGGK